MNFLTRTEKKYLPQRVDDDSEQLWIDLAAAIWAAGKRGHEARRVFIRAIRIVVRKGVAELRARRAV